MIYHNLIEGSSFNDSRGTLRFINDLDLTEVVRFYEIVPASTSIVRAWQGHKREKKWFYCNSGAFIVNLIKIDNFETPSKNLLAHQFELSVDSPKVLEISGGYATGFRSLEENSHLMVFSNFTLEESKADDFRFSLETWKANW